MTSILYIDGGGPVSCEYIASVGGTATSSPLAVGDAVEGRIVAVIITYTVAGGENGSIASATIDGIAADILVQRVYNAGDSTGDPGVAIIAARVDAGTSVTVVCTATATISAAYSSYRILNMPLLTVFDTAGFASDPGTTSESVSIDTRDNGILLVGGSIGYDGAVALSGAPTDFLFASAITRLGGHDLTSAEVGRTLTVAGTSGALSLFGSALAAVSF